MKLLSRFHTRVFTIIALMACLITPAYAQQYGIVAIVDGEAISNVALSERVTMIINSSGLKPTAEIQQRVAVQALQLLINETLQRQHAALLGLKATDKELDDAIRDLEQKNNLEPGEFDNFIIKQGINPKTVREQVHSQILWQKVVNRRVRPLIAISNFEVKDTIEWLSSRQNQQEVYLSAIYLPVNAPEQEQEVRSLAEKLVQELRDGANFSNMAKQFSSDSNAAQGGTVGWIPEERLDSKIQTIIKSAPAHSITSPVRTSEGYQIFKIGNRRTNSDAQDEAKIRNILTLKKTELASRKYMQDLRDAAFVEIRL